MNIEVGGKTIQTDEQGFLQDIKDWSEAVAQELADRDGIELTETHWGLIEYFREYYQENLQHPSMRTLVLTLGKHHGESFREEKAYERFLYKLFPMDPVNEICKLAGLPKPAPYT